MPAVESLASPEDSNAQSTSPVSVILPVFNAGHGLANCLQRLDATRLPENTEIIIVDDGSTDETAETIRTYAEERPHVLPIFQPTNIGVANARNAALRAAGGEYVWFVDWDDEWELGIVELLLNRAKATGADVVVCRAQWQLASGARFGIVDGIDTPRLMTGAEAFDAVLAGQFKGYLWSKLLRRSLLPVDMFPQMTSQSDFCGLIPVIAGANLVASEPSVQYSHVVRDGSLTNSKNFRLDNLTICRNVVRDVAASQPRSHQRDQLLLRYDYAHWYLGRAKVAQRLNDATTAKQESKYAASVMKVSEIAALLPIDARVAIHSLAVKATGSRYPTFRRFAMSMRSKLRTLRLRGR